MSKQQFNRLKQAKFNYKVAKKQYQSIKKNGGNLLVSKQKLQQAKKDYQVLKVNYPTHMKRVKQLTQHSVTKQLTYASNHILQQDDTLHRWAQYRINYQKARYSGIQIKKVGHVSIRVSKYMLKRGYGLSNRVYNVTKGRGFTRTPSPFSWYTQLKNKWLTAKRIQQLKKVNNAKRIAHTIISPFTKTVGRVLRNPFSFTGVLNFFLLLIMFMPFLGSGIIKQNEFDLTDTWVYFTKLDRVKSDDRVVYYSNIDDSLFYINYNYDKIVKSNAIQGVSMPSSPTGSAYIERLWGGLNGNYNELKSIKDMYTSEGEYYLQPNEQMAYEQLVAYTDNVGKYVHLNDLVSFLHNPEDKQQKEPTLQIIERYGYVSLSTLSETSTIRAESHANLYASLKGVITLEGENIIISSDKARLTFYDVNHIRVTNGQQVKSGEWIGQVKQSGNQVVKYEKLKRLHEKDENGKTKTEWKSVNIGFYLPKVVYTQETSVIQSIDLSDEKVSRARSFVTAIKQRVPNATEQGIAAILGNFDIESGINPKMAEGDYLRVPVGKTDDSSYDNEEWLNIGGLAIYGRYPNILKRGIGLGQWTDTADGSIRHTLLREYAKAKNQKWYDLDLQVDFMLNGDTPFYKQVLYTVLTSTDSVESLTQEFLNKWEGNPGNKENARIALAKSWLGLFTTRATGQPLDNMADVIVTSEFGEHRSLVLQDGRFFENKHQGIDLVYADGRIDAPVYAIGDGKVVIADYISGGGYSVIIQHAPDFYTYYYHLKEQPVVSVGQQITSGKMIGIMGSTGNSTGVHLHLGFSKQLFFEFYDPRPFLTLRK